MLAYNRKKNSSCLIFSRPLSSLATSKFWFSLAYAKQSVRLFSSTLIKKADPLGFTALTFTVPHASSVLVNPLMAGIILLIGMGTSLIILTSNLDQFFGVSPELLVVLRRLDIVFLLYETFISTAYNDISILLANLGNFTPESLTNFYFVLQQFISVTESLFNAVTELMDLPEIRFIPRPAFDRLNDIHHNLRGIGNDVMDCIREIEDMLNIPEDDRIPNFWFED